MICLVSKETVNLWLKQGTLPLKKNLFNVNVQPLSKTVSLAMKKSWYKYFACLLMTVSQMPLCFLYAVVGGSFYCFLLTYCNQLGQHQSFTGTLQLRLAIKKKKGHQQKWCVCVSMPIELGCVDGASLHPACWITSWLALLNEPLCKPEHTLWWSTVKQLCNGGNRDARLKWNGSTVRVRDCSFMA